MFFKLRSATMLSWFPCATHISELPIPVSPLYTRATGIYTHNYNILTTLLSSKRNDPNSINVCSNPFWLSTLFYRYEHGSAPVSTCGSNELLTGYYACIHSNKPGAKIPWMAAQLKSITYTAASLLSSSYSPGDWGGNRRNIGADIK